jgi:hypothetical protein
VNCGARFFIESNSGPANKQIVIVELGSVPEAAQGATVPAAAPPIVGSAVLPPEGDDEHAAMANARARLPMVINRLPVDIEHPLSRDRQMD